MLPDFCNIFNDFLMMLKDSQRSKKAQLHRGLAEKVRDWLRDFAMKVQRAFRHVTASHREALTLREAGRYIENLQEMWDEALVDSVKGEKAKPVKITAREVGQAASKKKSTESERMSLRYGDFSKQVDALYPQITLDEKVSHITVRMDTPQILITEAGAPDLPIIIEKKKAILALYEKSEYKGKPIDGNFHGMGESFKEIEKAIENPVGMIKNNKRNRINEFVVIDGRNGPVLVSVEFNAYKRINRDSEAEAQGNYNLVITAFEPATNNYIKNLLDDESVQIIYPVKDEDAAHFIARLNNPWNDLTSSSDINILDKGENGQERRSERDRDSLSPREILATALKDAEGERVSYHSLVAKPDMELAALEDNIENTDRESIVATGLRNVREHGRIGASGMAAVYVNDIDEEVHVSKRSLVHGLDRRVEKQTLIVQHVGEVLKNSVLINVAAPKVQSASESYLLLGAGIDRQENVHYALFTVNRFTNDVEQIDVLYAVNAKRKNQPAAGPEASANALSPTGSYSISIADLIDDVKGLFGGELSENVRSKLGITGQRETGIRGLKYSECDIETITAR